MSVSLRPVSHNDFHILTGLIEELAVYEKLIPPDEAAQRRLRNDILGDRPRIQAYLVSSGGKDCGYFIVLETYSSFLARPSLYLEDLYIQPEFRRGGIGTTVFDFLKTEARRRGCGRIEWVVLDWNEPALQFYNKLGATWLREWKTYRMVIEPD